MAVTQALVERFKPIVYVPKETDDAKIIEVLYEIFENYAVLWYHWPYDDYENREDYEPIILVFRNDLLVRIGTRPHKKYRKYNSWNAEEGRPIIVFTTSFHGPSIPGPKFVDSLIGFFATHSSDMLADYGLEQGHPPEWFIKDGTKIEVYSYANSIADIA